jgi:hypothetical protein
VWGGRTSATKLWAHKVEQSLGKRAILSEQGRLQRQGWEGEKQRREGVARGCRGTMRRARTCGSLPEVGWRRSSAARLRSDCASATVPCQCSSADASPDLARSIARPARAAACHLFEDSGRSGGGGVEPEPVPPTASPPPPPTGAVAGRSCLKRKAARCSSGRHSSVSKARTWEVNGG